jgi:integrase
MKPHRALDVARVHILGKGRKHRQCPLWPDTVLELSALVLGRSASERVFLNRCGQPMTRFGAHALGRTHGDEGAKCDAVTRGEAGQPAQREAHLGNTSAALWR